MHDLKHGLFWLALLGAGLFMVSARPVAFGANMTPIAATGYNRDVMIENTASGPPYTAAAQNFNSGENNVFYQSGLAGTTLGLPVSGAFTSAVGDGTQF